MGQTQADDRIVEVKIKLWESERDLLKQIAKDYQIPLYSVIQRLVFGGVDLEKLTERFAINSGKASQIIGNYQQLVADYQLLQMRSEVGEEFVGLLQRFEALLKDVNHDIYDWENF